MRAQDYTHVVGVCGEERTPLVNTPTNVAAYLLERGGENFSVKSPDESQVIFSSYGFWIDRCYDTDYMRAVVHKLEPMQQRLVKPPQVQIYEVPKKNTERNR